MKWYIARFVDNGHQKDICHDEIGLCDQDLDTIFRSNT